MTARAALTHIHDTLTSLSARPAMYGTTSETVLFQALALLDVRATLLGGDECRASYEAAKAERGIPCAHRALLPMGEIGAFLADVYARERQRLPDAPTTQERLLSLRVDFRDEPAAAEITPEMAAVYLTARGYTVRGAIRWHVWTRDGRQVLVPRERLTDYGRRMVETITALAEIEGRSALAVWAEMRR